MPSNIVEIVFRAQDQVSGPTKSVKVSLDGAEKAAKGAEGGFSGLGGAIARARDTMVGFLGARILESAGRGILNVAKSAIAAASDAEEMGSKFEAVFKELSIEVRAWADKQSAEVNRSSFAFVKYLSTLQDTFVPMGFARDQAAELSKKMTLLAVDLASFNNASEPDTVNLLTSALVGNHEAVRRFGIQITEATLNQELMNMGIAKGSSAATEQQKVLARLNIILKSSTDAQGDAARTAGSYANLVRGLEGAWEKVSVELGQAVLPVLQDLLKNSLIPLTNQTAQYVRENKELIQIGVKDWFDRIAGAIQAAADMAAKARPIFSAFSTALAGIFGTPATSQMIRDNFVKAMLAAGASQKQVLEGLIAMGVPAAKAQEALNKQIGTAADLVNALVGAWEKEKEANEKHRKGVLEATKTGAGLVKQLKTEDKSLKDLQGAFGKLADKARGADSVISNMRAWDETEEGAERSEDAVRQLDEAIAGRLSRDLKEFTRDTAFWADVQNDATDEVLFTADAMRELDEVIQKANEANKPQTFAAGWSEAFQKWSQDVESAKATGERAFRAIHTAMSAGLSDAIFLSAQGKFNELADVVDNFGKRVLRSLSDIAADRIAKEVLGAASGLVGPIIEGGKKLFGFAEGGLVTKPTLGVLGEAGPELVIPLKLAGEFVKGSIVEAAKTAAFEEAAAAFATSEAGVAASAAGVGDVTAASAGTAAAGAAGALTSAALFLFIDAANQGKGTRAIGAALLGRGGEQGLIPKGLGALGLGAFRGGRSDPHAAGLANVESIRRQFGEAAEALGGLPFTAQDLIDFTGGNPFSALAILQEQGAFLGGVGGDAAGRFVTGPSLRLIGEAGPEHVLNVDSEASVRALQEGLRPIVRELFEEMGFRGGGGGKTTVVVQLVLNGRAIQEISREVDTAIERFPRTPRTPRRSFSGV